MPATVLDLLNIQREDVPGGSLARYWQPGGTASPEADAIVSESSSFSRSHAAAISGGYMRSLISDRHHYILNHDGREELYDFHADPAERHNLADADEAQALITRFRARVAALSREENRPVPPGLVR